MDGSSKWMDWFYSLPPARQEAERRRNNAAKKERAKKLKAAKEKKLTRWGKYRGKLSKAQEADLVERQRINQRRCRARKRGEIYDESDDDNLSNSDVEEEAPATDHQEDLAVPEDLNESQEKQDFAEYANEPDQALEVQDEENSEGAQKQKMIGKQKFTVTNEQYAKAPKVGLSKFLKVKKTMASNASTDGKKHDDRKIGLSKNLKVKVPLHRIS